MSVSPTGYSLVLFCKNQCNNKTNFPGESERPSAVLLSDILSTPRFQCVPKSIKTAVSSNDSVWHDLNSHCVNYSLSSQHSEVDLEKKNTSNHNYCTRNLKKRVKCEQKKTKQNKSFDTCCYKHPLLCTNIAI
jgi:hypothetical protein